jgi:hypothetical protein
LSYPISKKAKILIAARLPMTICSKCILLR